MDDLVSLVEEQISYETDFCRIIGPSLSVIEAEIPSTPPGADSPFIAIQSLYTLLKYAYSFDNGFLDLPDFEISSIAKYFSANQPQFINLFMEFEAFFPTDNSFEQIFSAKALKSLTSALSGFGISFINLVIFPFSLALRWNRFWRIIADACSMAAPEYRQISELSCAFSKVSFQSQNARTVKLFQKVVNLLKESKLAPGLTEADLIWCVEGRLLHEKGSSKAWVMIFHRSICVITLDKAVIISPPERAEVLPSPMHASAQKVALILGLQRSVFFEAQDAAGYEAMLATWAAIRSAKARRWDQFSPANLSSAKSELEWGNF